MAHEHCSQYISYTLVALLAMLAIGPEHSNFYTKPLESQGPVVDILEHLDTVWSIEKIICLSPMIEPLVRNFSLKVFVIPNPN